MSDVQRADRDVELEARVLGTCCFRPGAATEILPRLTEEHFWYGPHRSILAVMLELQGEGTPLDDPRVLADRLRQKGQLDRVGGIAYLARLMESMPAVAPMFLFKSVDRLEQLSRLRKLVDLCREVEATANAPIDNVTEFIDGVEQKIYGIAGRRDGDSFHTLKDSLKELLTEVYKEIEAKEAKKTTRASTGLVEVDRLVGGLQNGQFIIIAARPSMGKTAFMLNMASYVASQPMVPRLAAHVITAETRHTRIAARILGQEARFETSKLWQGGVTLDDFKKLQGALPGLSALPVSMDDRSAPTLAQIRASIRRAEAAHRKVDENGKVIQKLGAVFFDYLQLARHPTKGGNREQEVGAIAYGLLQIAKDFDIPVVALSQLNRAVENRQNHRPTLSDLRESGNIENAADAILALYRDEYYDDKSDDRGLAEVIVLKSKDTATGTVKVKFTKQWMRFDNLEEEPPQ